MVVTKVVGMPELKFLHFDLSQELNDAASICKLDIQQHFKEHKRIDTEGPLKPLAPSTIAAKSKASKGKRYTAAEAARVRKHAHDPLIATENLMFNQKLGKATPSRQEATVQIGPTRETIYSYHDDTRPVFGISEGVDTKIDHLFEARIDRILGKVFND